MAVEQANKGPKGPAIRAIVGLGNPGKQYAATRHNVGFMVIERLAERLGVSWSGKFNGNLARGRMMWRDSAGAGSTGAGSGGASGERDLILLQPLQFMNLSGHATQAMAQFYGIKPAELLVIHDDLDLPFGKVQLKVGGGHGGHNGLRSLVAQLGSPEFARLRIGIGRPGSDASAGGRAAEREGAKGGDDAVANWVLSPFSPSERAELPGVVDKAVQAAESAVQLGLAAAMNVHNTVVKPVKLAKPATAEGAEKPAAKPNSDRQGSQGT